MMALIEFDGVKSAGEPIGVQVPTAAIGGGAVQHDQGGLAPIFRLCSLMSGNDQ